MGSKCVGVLSTSSTRFLHETSATCHSVFTKEELAHTHTLNLSAVCCLCHTYIPVHQTQCRISKLDIRPCLTYLKWLDGLWAERVNLTPLPPIQASADTLSLQAWAVLHATNSSPWLVLLHKPVMISYWTLTSNRCFGPMVTDSAVCSVEWHAFPL